MNAHGVDNRQASLLAHLNGLPKRIVHLHGQENMSEFVLHNLCCTNGFNINRAAFLVENPDFDCLKGVAGYCRTEDVHDHSTIWDDPTGYTKHMSDAVYNNKVRTLLREYTENLDQNSPVFIEIVEALDISDPQVCRWKMKHDNSGLLIYERPEEHSEEVADHLHHGAHLLSFCPVF